MDELNETENEWETTKTQIFNAARAIPKGRVTSYGALGKCANPPISGYVCGRILGNVPADVPWWRVVGKDGQLPIRKRHPDLEKRQKTLLKAEGVSWDEKGRIESRLFAE